MGKKTRSEWDEEKSILVTLTTKMMSTKGNLSLWLPSHRAQRWRYGQKLFLIENSVDSLKCSFGVVASAITCRTLIYPHSTVRNQSRRTRTHTHEHETHIKNVMRRPMSIKVFVLDSAWLDSYTNEEMHTHTQSAHSHSVVDFFF